MIQDKGRERLRAAILHTFFIVLSAVFILPMLSLSPLQVRYLFLRMVILSSLESST